VLTKETGAGEMARNVVGHMDYAGCGCCATSSRMCAVGTLAELLRRVPGGSVHHAG